MHSKIDQTHSYFATALQTINDKRQILLILAGFLTLALTAALCLPAGVDWVRCYRPAALSAITGASYPFTTDLPYLNPPWLLFLLIPLAILPANLGYGVLVALGITAYIYTFRKLGADWVSTVVLLTCPPVLIDLVGGNITWLVILAFTFPPALALPILLLKPQVGIGLAAFQLIEAYRERGIRRVIEILTPLGGLTVISFLIYGFWPTRIPHIIQIEWNASLYPGAIFIGLASFAYSLRTRKANGAIASSPFVAPYLHINSWTVPLIGLIPYRIEMIAGAIGLWFWVITRL